MAIRKKAAALWLLLPLLILCGCAGEPNQKPAYKINFFAMDTFIEITCYDPGFEETVEQMKGYTEELDQLYFSATDSRSELYRLNAEKDCALSEETADVLFSAKMISKETGGAFSVTLGPLVKEWGFYDKALSIPTPQRIEELLALVDDQSMEVGERYAKLMPGTSVDLGGIAKGYAASLVAKKLAESGVQSAILSFGGNVQAIGLKPDGQPWKVGVQDPFDTGQMVGVLTLRDNAAVTSGDYQRYFEEDGVRYHHILDPQTGSPANRGLKSVTVVCANGTYADALSTALFVMGLERGLAFWRTSDFDFEALFITDEREIIATSGLEGQFIISDTTQFTYRITD